MPKAAARIRSLSLLIGLPGGRAAKVRIGFTLRGGRAASAAAVSGRRRRRSLKLADRQPDGNHEIQLSRWANERGDNDWLGQGKRESDVGRPACCWPCGRFQQTG